MSQKRLTGVLQDKVKEFDFIIIEVYGQWFYFHVQKSPPVAVRTDYMREKQT